MLQNEMRLVNTRVQPLHGPRPLNTAKTRHPGCTARYCASLRHCTATTWISHGACPVNTTTPWAGYTPFTHPFCHHVHQKPTVSRSPLVVRHVFLAAHAEAPPATLSHSHALEHTPLSLHVDDPRRGRRTGPYCVPHQCWKWAKRMGEPALLLSVRCRVYLDMPDSH